jgi:hypothetical protein
MKELSLLLVNYLFVDLYQVSSFPNPLTPNDL